MAPLVGQGGPILWPLWPMQAAAVELRGPRSVPQRKVVLGRGPGSNTNRGCGHQQVLGRAAGGRSGEKGCREAARGRGEAHSQSPSWVGTSDVWTKPQARGTRDIGRGGSRTWCLGSNLDLGPQDSRDPAVP